MSIEECRIWEICDDYICNLLDSEILELSKVDEVDGLGEWLACNYEDEVFSEDDISTISEYIIDEVNSYIINQKEDCRIELKENLEKVLDDSSEFLDDIDKAYILSSLTELYLRPEW